MDARLRTVAVLSTNRSLAECFPSYGRSLEKMQREDALRMQELRVEWARHQDRENYKRELEQLQQLRDQQRWEEGNRATAY